MTIENEDFDFGNILLDENLYKIILIRDISYETLIIPKPSGNCFDKIDGFIRVNDGTRYFVLLGSEECDAIYDRIRHLISQKSGITYIISHNYAIIKIGKYDSWPLEKTLSLYNVIILIKSVFKKYQNHNYYNWKNVFGKMFI